MSMKDGIRDLVHGALDTKDETMQLLLDNGFDVQTAMKVSTVLVKKSVDDRLERHLADRNASEITSALSSQRCRLLS